MSKIKVSLASGNIFEKPLVTCFQGTSANYIVFDNEMNGSMGLPIICISKLVGNKLEKIYDQSEWSSVKENLKSIISGNNFIYLTIPENLTAQDDFFTQLTLPVASFDVLKNAYKPPVPETPQVVPVAPEVMPTLEPVAPVETPIEQNIMDSPITMGPSVNSQVLPNQMMPNMVSPTMPNSLDQNISNINPIQNIAQPNTQNIMQTQQTNPFVNTLNQALNDENLGQLSQINNNEINQVKETFMKSCENVFDALVKIMENK
ncbi:MAG: hypothetical protein ACI4XR_01030 [Bacilli bacterium]